MSRLSRALLVVATASLIVTVGSDAARAAVADVFARAVRWCASTYAGHGSTTQGCEG